MRLQGHWRYWSDSTFVTKTKWTTQKFWVRNPSGKEFWFLGKHGKGHRYPEEIRKKKVPGNLVEGKKEQLK
jgi:hypothetical protein